MTECSLWAKAQDSVGMGGSPGARLGAGHFSGRLSRVAGPRRPDPWREPRMPAAPLCPTILCEAASLPLHPSPAWLQRGVDGRRPT